MKIAANNMKSINSLQRCLVPIITQRLSADQHFIANKQQHRHAHTIGRSRPFSNYLAKSVLGKAVAPGVLKSGAGKAEVMEFSKMLPNVVRDLTDSGRHQDVSAALKRFAKVLQYNVTGGKKNRGLAVVLSYRLLAPKDDLTADTMEKAQIMGWCLEMLHASLLMTQDVLDGTDTRRGKPCWYLAAQNGVNPVPLVAMNDANLIVTGIYQLLKMHFKDQPYYTDVIELFQDVWYRATMGQVIDIETRADKTLNQFTMDRYKAITKYKTAYHTFQMPVSLALYMAGLQDKEVHRQAKTILMEMGQFYQVMADYMNCFGDEEECFGLRSGSDIEDGKCTWLAVVALQRASKEQKQFLQENYGVKSQECVLRVKELYHALGLPSTYKIYEEQTYDLLCTQIQQISRGLPHKLFFRFLDNIYVRSV